MHTVPKDGDVYLSPANMTPDTGGMGGGGFGGSGGGVGIGGGPGGGGAGRCLGECRDSLRVNIVRLLRFEVVMAV